MVNEILRIIKAAQLAFGGGPCGDVAIAINRIIFNNQGTLIIIANEELLKRGMFQGHVVVEDSQGNWWDGTGLVNKDDQIKNAGRWGDGQVFGDYLAYKYDEDDPELDILFDEEGNFNVTDDQLNKNIVRISTEEEIRTWLGQQGLSKYLKALRKAKKTIKKLKNPLGFPQFTSKFGLRDEFFGADIVAEYALDRHFPKWDTQARSESDLANRVKKSRMYQLQLIDLNNLETESPYSFYWTNVEKLRREIKKEGAYFPIILNKRHEIVDGWHRANALKILGEKYIWALVPVKLNPDVTQQWQDWVEDPGGQIDRRKIIVQIINALRLAHQWQSYDKALANIKFMGVGPQEATESIAEAVKLARLHGWIVQAIRQDLR